MTPSFAPFADEFMMRIREIVVCTATTVDSRNRPRSRMLHPVWEMVDGLPIGWIATSQTPVKTAHLAANPAMSCMYWSPANHTVSVDCMARWATELEKPYVWDLFMSTPPPLGYDVSGYRPDRWHAALFTPLRLDPWRIQLLSAEEHAVHNLTPRTWRADPPRP